METRMHTTTHTPHYYTPTQLAEALQVQRRTIYIWIRDKKLRAVHAGSRVRIEEQAVQDFLAGKGNEQ
jgi:excisionase family DNA binding protein